LFAADFPPPFHGESVMVRNIVESDFANEFNLQFVDTTPVRNVKEIDGKIGVRKIFSTAKAFISILKKLFSEDVDIFYKNLSSTKNGFLRDFILCIPAVLSGKKIILHMHCSNFGDFYSKQGFFVKKLVRFLLNRAELLIVPCELHRLQFKGIVESDKIVSVPNGTGSFSNRKKKFNLKEPTVLFLSNLFESKGYFVLLEAIPLVLKSCPGASFVFAGAETEDFNRQRVDSFLRMHGLEEKVLFTGPVSGKAKENLLKNADLFALPTFYRREAMPVTILEAMAFGLPIVSTDTSSIPFIVKDRENGLIIPVKDVKKLSQAITLLLSDKQFMEHFLKIFQKLSEK